VTIPENMDAVHSMVLETEEYLLKRQQRLWQYLEKEKVIFTYEKALS
jgi:hypothetical protein